MFIRNLTNVILFSSIFGLTTMANAETNHSTHITTQNAAVQADIVQNTAVQSDIVQIASQYDFEETIQRLKKSIAAKGLTLFATINHAQAAHQVGLDLPPKTVLIFGSPIAGTPIMQEHPSVALDLPFRVLVAEGEDHGVYVSYHSPKSLAVHQLSEKQLSLLSKLAALVNNTVN